MKAQVGDYVRVPGGRLRQVTGICGSDGAPGCGYALDDGTLVADAELAAEDVLLESEAHEEMERGSTAPSTRKEAFCRVWDGVIVGICGARGDADDRAAFVAHHAATSEHYTEYRFIGELGFGGKFRTRRDDERWWVDCYPEDETAERRAMIAKANVELECLRGSVPL